MSKQRKDADMSTISKTDKTKRVIGIVRVSEQGDREDDSFASPEIQADKIRKDCEREGETLVEILEEIDVSGGKPLAKRTKGLLPAVEAVEAGRADIIKVAYFDRLVRSLKVQQEVVDRVEAAGGEVFTLDFGKLTNGTAAKRLSGNIIGAVNQFVREQIAEKSAEGQESAVAKGHAPGVVPPGYLRGPDKVLVPDPATREAVKSAFIRRAGGATFSEVRDYLSEQGIERTIGGVRKLLMNATYLGEIHFGKLVNLHAHEAIIDRDIFNQVQRMTVRAGRKTKSDRLLARQDVLRCSQCHGRMSASKTQTGWSFYRCSGEHDGNHQTIGAELVEGITWEAVCEMLSDAVGRASAEEDRQIALATLQTAEKALSRAKRRALLADIEDDSEAVELIGEVSAERDRAQVEVDRYGPEYGEVASVQDADTVAKRRAIIRATRCQVTIGPGRGAERIAVTFGG